MGFRTVVIQSPCKLSYKDGFMIVRGDEVRTIHISEIHTLIVETTMASVTGYLLCELMKAKVNVVFCDEKRQPIGELHPCYGSYDTAGRVAEQAAWLDERKGLLWQTLIRQKIMHQGQLLKTADPDAADMIYTFAENVEPNDATNREGHAAKVYFNRIFGSGFSRQLKSDRNAALDYGYSILLSMFSREIVARGYCTQLGIHHRNPFNQYNLASDLMEPFRILVDRIVLRQKDAVFDKAYKHTILGILGEPVRYNSQHMLLTTAVTRFVRNTTEYLSGRIEWSESMGFCYEDTADATDGDV